MSDTGRKLMLYMSIGIGLMLLVAQISSWPIYIRGGLLIIGGWLMAIGSLYQVKLYAEDKDIFYYGMIIFAALLWICMLALTLFFVAVLIGWA